MAHLIDKSALVAEIEKRMERAKFKAQQAQENNDYVSCVGWSEHFATCGDILRIIDTLEVKEIGVDLGDPKGDKSAKYIIDTKTLEVKEVDLEKEIESWMRDNTDTAGFFDTTEFAKHFFERGMRFSAVGSDYIEGVRGYCETTTK